MSVESEGEVEEEWMMKGDMSGLCFEMTHDQSGCANYKQSLW